MSGWQQDNNGHRRVGLVSQRDLRPLLRVLVDASNAKSGSRTRDEARAALRQVLDTCNWNTPAVLNNIGVRRCKVIARMGYPVPYAYLDASRGLDRLERLGERQRG